jgi:hypothetical protein
MLQVVAGNLANLRERIARAATAAGRNPADLRLIAVTKTESPAVLATLAAAGCLDWGENRVEHLMTMVQEGGGIATTGRFHFLGRVQGRQFRRLAPHCAVLHSLADHDHVARLERACAEAGRHLEVFCQVATGHDPAKAGCQPDDLPRLLDAVNAAPHLQVVGLMTMAPLAAPESICRDCFATCRILADRHGLARLSMGMSDDFPWAIQEGATDLRIGTAIFTGPAV